MAENQPEAERRGICMDCRSPVFWSGSAWFHDIRPRWLATIARNVEEKEAPKK